MIRELPKIVKTDERQPRFVNHTYIVLCDLQKLTSVNRDLNDMIS